MPCPADSPYCKWSAFLKLKSDHVTPWLKSCSGFCWFLDKGQDLQQGPQRWVWSGPYVPHWLHLPFNTDHTRLLLSPSRLFLTSGPRMFFHTFRKPDSFMPPYILSEPHFHLLVALCPPQLCICEHFTIVCHRCLESLAHQCFSTSSMGPVI